MGSLLLIQTGGTIGSVITDGIADVSCNSVSLQEFMGDTTIDVVQPLQLLSENLTPEKWRIMIETIQKGIRDAYDGILVAHGSDTLPYTAAMLGYLFGPRTKIPIVLTAANYPPADPRSNARENLTAAIAFLHKSLPGCYVVWTNPGCKTELHLATRMAEAGYLRDTFSFYGDMPLSGTLGTPAIPTDFSFDLPSVFMLKNYPGLNYATLDFTEEPPVAILHNLYHSGTGCVTTDVRYDLPNFVQRMARHGIPVYGLGLKNGGTTYASIPPILESGLRPLPLMTQEAALVKLQLAYALCPEDPLNLLCQNWYYEILE